MKEQKKTHNNLRNNLYDHELSDEEYEELRTAYEFEKSERQKPDKGARIAKIAGTIFLILGILFLIQQFFFSFGPDFTSLLRFIPTGGTIIILIIGLGLLGRIRSKKRSRRMDPTPNNQPGGDRWNTSTTGDAEETTAGRPCTSADFDPYAFRNTKRWFRSRKEKMLFGVCGEIAERLNIDPTVIRALFVIAFFSYGFSFVIYIALAIALPRRPLQKTWQI
ncbi:PspC domain-containing protein [Balneolales bacterium ANBcel1]|nr:PspC domain-containing protein [Balneolales bacterium ANBcel1]